MSIRNLKIKKFLNKKKDFNPECPFYCTCKGIICVYNKKKRGDRDVRIYCICYNTFSVYADRKTFEKVLLNWNQLKKCIIAPDKCIILLNYHNRKQRIGKLSYTLFLMFL